MERIIFFALGCLAVGSDALICTPRPVHPLSSDYCLYILPTLNINCAFYRDCIETILPCERPGLALGYATPRCDQLQILRHSEAAWPKCIQNQAILNWLQLSEKWFQSQFPRYSGTGGVWKAAADKLLSGIIHFQRRAIGVDVREKNLMFLSMDTLDNIAPFLTISS